MNYLIQAQIEFISNNTLKWSKTIDSPNVLVYTGTCTCTADMYVPGHVEVVQGAERSSNSVPVFYFYLNQLLLNQTMYMYFEYMYSTHLLLQVHAFTCEM